MALPHINHKKNGLELSDELLNLVDEKLRSLEKFIEDAPTVCDVEFEKVTDQQQGDVYRLEVNLEVNGKLYRAEATMESFEHAIDEVRDELDKEMRRTSKKKETLFRKGSRKIKEMLRGGKS